jgi:hypothetical protein
MESKAQILTNIVLVLSFAFSVYVSVQTNKEISGIRKTFDVIELRDKIYYEARMKSLQNFNNAIKKVEEQIKTEQDRLNTL